MKSTLHRFRSLFALTLILSCSSFFAAAEEREVPLPRLTIDWGGKSWTVRGSNEPVGPLDNYFSPWPENVFVDGEGKLHLRIRPQDDIWRASEVILKRKFGYGSYEWKIETPLSDLDPSSVLGLFTWSDNTRYANREIDIEFSAWGDASRREQGQYVVQPYDLSGNMKTFPLAGAIGPTSHSFTWLPDRIEFASWTGFGPRPRLDAGFAPLQGSGDKPANGLDKPGSILASWTFTDVSRIPKPGNEYVHINFYLVEGGKAPSRGKPLDIVISGFSFTPWKTK